ncbi:MAG TPA: hydroxyacid dehydrogenase, partial [Candidatus Krumholzibacteria bacterium]|nr:hydroxyacid dehydrogenase [Candidatus Krumholzibacteria bacterium]
VGLDKIDLQEASRRGIVVFNTPGGNAVAAAELTFALLLALVRKLVQGHLALAQGEWERQRYVGTELAGKKLGVVGVGRIGTLVAERARAFGMQILAHDPFLSDERAAAEGFTKLELHDLLRRADILTLHLPLSDETRGLIGSEEIALMQRGALLVNCARGGLVDESALTRALQSGHLAGAALDVYEEEPPSAGHPLLSMEQVVHTPHLGASTKEAKSKVGIAAARSIVEFLREGSTAGAVNSPD